MALENSHTIDLGDGNQVRIPEFATEKTLLQLTTALEKAGIKLDKSAKLEKDANKKLDEMVDAQLDLFKDQQKQSKKDRETENKNTATISKIMKDNGKKLDASQSVLKKAMDNIAGSGGVFGSVLGGLSKFGRFINPLTAAFAGLAKGAAAAFKFLMRLGRLENTLFRTGLSGFNDVEGQVSGGIATFAKQALDASLSIDQFAELTQQFSTTVGEFGTDTVASAIKSTRDLIRDQGFLGLSVSEMAGVTAEVADVLRQLGFQSGTSKDTLALQSVQLLRTTQAFTKLTNASNELIRSLTLQASQVEAFTNAMQMISDPNSRLATTASAQTAFAGLAAFGDAAGGELSTALSEAIGRGGLQFTQFGQDLQRTAPVLFTGLQNLANTVSANGNVAEALDQFRLAVGSVDENSRQFLRALEISGDPMAKFVIKLANLNETIDDANFQQMKNMEAIQTAGKLGEAQAKLAEVIAQVKTAFQKVLVGFLTDDVINGFAKIMEVVILAFEKVANFVKGDFFNILNGYVNKLGEFLGRLFDGSLFNDVLGGMSKGLTTMFVGVLNKAMALVIGGGFNQDTFNTMDTNMASFKDAQKQMQGMSPGNPQYKALMKQQTDALKRMYLAQGGYDSEDIENFLTTGKDTSTMKNMARFLRGKGGFALGYGTEQTNMQMMNQIEKEMARYGYNFGNTGQGYTSQSNTSGINNDIVTGSQESSMFNFGTAQTKSNIKIMPMFGDSENPQKSSEEKLLDQYIKNNDLNEQQVQKLTEMVNELVKINANTKDAMLKAD